MASTTLRELQYRTFDELLGEVQTDFTSFDSDNTIESAELIKIAIKCNKQLGLKINKTKQTILDISHGKAKLPADFDQMNIALLCNQYSIVTPSVSNGIQSHTVMTSRTDRNTTACPCWTVTCTQETQVPVTLCDGSASSVQTFPAGESSICATNIDISNATPGTITLSSGSFCHYDPISASYVCGGPSCGTCNQNPCSCVNPQPWTQDRVYTLCNDTIGVQVIQECQYETRCYVNFEKLYMEPAKEATSFCINSQFRNCGNTGYISGNFIYLNNNSFCKLYICYEGQMENDQGELLVLDHPVINEFYEYSLKERILENLYINGEPDLERRLNLVQQKRKAARIEAMSIVNMPDYREIVNGFANRRLDIYNRYVKPFERQLMFSWYAY